MNSLQVSCRMTLLINSSSINNEIDSDSTSFDKYDLNFLALRNFTNLNEKEIIENYSHLEQIFVIFS
jgi:hypothetical protein